MISFGCLANRQGCMPFFWVDLNPFTLPRWTSQRAVG